VLIFCDTEFTDFIDCDLISIGLVSEDGKSEFYAERRRLRVVMVQSVCSKRCSASARKTCDVVCSRDELSQRLWTWFRTLPRHVKVACDSMHDRDLLWDAFERRSPGKSGQNRHGPAATDRHHSIPSSGLPVSSRARSMAPRPTRRTSTSCRMACVDGCNKGTQEWQSISRTACNS
jgi:hypothetical protein